MSEQDPFQHEPGQPLARSALRRVLRNVLPYDVDFEAFCLDHFAEVQIRFGSGMERIQKENLLMQLVSPTMLSQRLWELYPHAFQKASREAAANPRAAGAPAAVRPMLKVWQVLILIGLAAAALGHSLLPSRQTPPSPTHAHPAESTVNRPFGTDGIARGLPAEGPATPLPGATNQDPSRRNAPSTAPGVARPKPRSRVQTVPPPPPPVTAFTVQFVVDARIGDTVVLLRDSDKALIKQGVVSVSHKEYGASELVGIPKLMLNADVSPGSYTVECRRGNQTIRHPVHIASQTAGNDVEIKCK